MDVCGNVDTVKGESVQYLLKCALHSTLATGLFVKVIVLVCKNIFVIVTALRSVK